MARLTGAALMNCGRAPTMLISFTGVEFIEFIGFIGLVEQLTLVRLVDQISQLIREKDYIDLLFIAFFACLALSPIVIKVKFDSAFTHIAYYPGRTPYH